MAKKLKPFPEGAICYTGANRSESDVKTGDWFVDGAWISAAEFAKIYELPPEPPDETAPTAPAAPLPPEPEPPVTPTLHRIVPIEDPSPPLSIGPSALDVDQATHEETV